MILTVDEKKQKCISLVKGWGNLSPDDILVEKMSGGLTNELSCVSVKPEVDLPIEVDQKVLFRIYGEDVSKFYSTEVELQTFQALSDVCIAPTLLGTFEGGRVETFINGFVLTKQNMKNPLHLANVANQVAWFHEADRAEGFPDFVKDPLGRASEWGQHCAEVLPVLKKFNPGKAAVIDSIPFQFLFKAANNLEGILRINEFKSTPAYKVVFCHNDLQENNIMVTSSKGGLGFHLIDFEYSAFGYAAYDIANHFQECTLDYYYPKYPFYEYTPKTYPSKAEQKIFIMCYLHRSQKTLMDSCTADERDEIVEHFRKAVDRFVMVSDLLWGFWSFIRAPEDRTLADDEFDFIVYGKARLDAFVTRYNRLLSISEIGNVDVVERAITSTPRALR